MSATSMITTTGVVIRERTVGEADKYVDILTADLGVVEVSVKGVRKITAKNAGATQLFAYSKLCLNRRGDRYMLNSSEPINVFYDMRFDLEKISLASYFGELIKFTVPAEEDCSEILRLFLNTLHFLNSNKRNNALLKSIFELRLLSEIGLMPHLLGCEDCLCFSDVVMFFNLRDGILKCQKCALGIENDSIIIISEGVLQAMRHICLSEQEKLFSFKVSSEVESKLSELTERYVHMQIGRTFKTLDFYKNILGGVTLE